MVVGHDGVFDWAALSFSIGFSDLTSETGRGDLPWLFRQSNMGETYAKASVKYTTARLF
jgi:hypothetical protein